MNDILIKRDEFLKEIENRIELFNTPGRIPDYDTRRHVIIQIINAIDKINRIKK